MRHDGYSVVANISLLFADVPLLDRAAAAKRCGFDGIETWSPFSTSHPASAEVDAFVKSVDDADVALVALSLYGGDQASGDRGILSWPDRRESFRSSLKVAHEVARRPECRLFNAPFGQRRDDLTEAEQYRTAVENLVSATRTMKDLGGTILLETLTSGENGNYPLASRFHAGMTGARN